MAVSIKKFYDGAEIFITGGSGFIGKALIEKLLRSCSGIKQIYLLVRPKKGATLGERLDKLTDNLVSKNSRNIQIHSRNFYFSFSNHCWNEIHTLRIK